MTSYLEDITSRQWDKIQLNAALADLLSRPDKTQIRAGDLLKRPTLASTLTKVMAGGADVLYTGPMAESLASEILDAGGILTAADLASYQPTIRDPINATVNGYTIIGAPPPSSGGATIIATARYLSYFPEPFAADLTTLSKHRMSEAMKHAFAMRMSLADPAFYPDVVDDVVRDMIETDYILNLTLSHSDEIVLPPEKVRDANHTGLHS